MLILSLTKLYEISELWVYREKKQFRKIIKKGEKYRIELYSYMTITQDIRSISAFIVVNKPNLMEEDFSLKSISLGPGKKAFGDPDGYGS